MIVVESLKDLPASEQAELIADKFAEVANEYDNLKKQNKLGLSCAKLRSGWGWLKLRYSSFT